MAKYLSLEKLKLYDQKIKKVISDGDAAALQAAKEYVATDEFVAQFDPAGSAATAKSEAIAYADGKDTAIAEAKKAGDDAQSALDAYKTTNDAAVAAAKAAADAAQGEVDALETYVGTIPEGATATDVVGYINEKTSGIATDAALTELTNKVSTAEGEIDTLQKEMDAVEQKAAKNETDITGLTAKIGTVPDGKDVVTMISDAQTAATYDDTQVKADIQANEDAITKLNANAETSGSVDYKIAQAVAQIMENPDDTMNSINELVTWCNEHAEDALALSNQVTQDGKDIDALEALVGSTAVATQITDAIAAALKIDGVDKYALAADLTAAIARIASLETAVGADGSVAGQISDAIAALDVEDTVVAGQYVSGVSETDGKITVTRAALPDYTEVYDAKGAAASALESANEYTDTEIDKVEGTIASLTETVGTKAAQSDLTALTGRVTTVEGKVSTLETEMDAVESKAAKNETDIASANTEIAKKANQTDLESAVSRIVTVETWQTNMVEISEEDIQALFA